MSRNTPEGQILTKFEAVLDSHHRTLPLWQEPRPEAIFATLAAFDLMMLPLTIGLVGAGPNPHTIQKIKRYHDSLIFAMRFFWKESQAMEVRPKADRVLIEKAFGLLSHCETYAMLVDMHVGYGRGMYTLEADAQQKRVRFVYARKDGSMPEPAGILEDTPTEWEYLRRANPEVSIKKKTIDAFQRVPHHWDKGCLLIDDFSALQQPILREALQYLLPAHEPSLNDEDDLGGLTAKELREFWHALFLWSMAASVLYLNAASKGKEQHECLPTQLVGRSHFVQAIAKLSGLSEQAVTVCLTRLTFGWKCPAKPDIYLQPLVCHADEVAWSPHLIQLSKYKRNMLKLMARVPELKPCADNLIGGKEAVLMSQLGKRLARHGYQFKTRVPLPDGTGEVDLIAFHRKYPSQLLVAETKSVLGVDEVNEVDQATRQMIIGQQQLRDSLAFLQKADVATKTLLWRGAPWNTIESYFGLVVTPNAQPNSSYDHRELPAVTFETITNYFHDSDFRSPARIWKTSVDKRWLKKYANSRTTYTPLQVGDIVYEIPLSVVE